MNGVEARRFGMSETARARCQYASGAASVSLLAIAIIGTYSLNPSLRFWGFAGSVSFLGAAYLLRKPAHVAELEYPRPELSGTFTQTQKGIEPREDIKPYRGECHLITLPKPMLSSILYFLDRATIARAARTCKLLRECSVQDPLTSGACFKESYTLESKGWGITHLDVFASPNSPHIVHLIEDRNSKTGAAFYLDQGETLSFIDVFSGEPRAQQAALFGDIVSYVPDGRTLHRRHIQSGESQKYDPLPLSAHLLCQDAGYTYTLTNAGMLLRYSSEVEISSLTTYYGDPIQFNIDRGQITTLTKLGGTLILMRKEHCNFNEIPDTEGRGEFRRFVPPHRYINHEALFYQFDHEKITPRCKPSPLYVFFFDTKTFKEIETGENVAILHTQGDVVLTSTATSLRLFNYRTGEALKTIPFDDPPRKDGRGAVLRGPEILISHGNRRARIYWD